MKIHLHLYLLTCFSAVLLFGCSKKESKTDISKPVSKQYTDVDDALTTAVNKEFGGKCYAVIQIEGKTVYSKGFGGYDGSTRQPIASCSKWLAAAVLMSLVDEGKLKLTDTVGKFLPIFTNYKKGGITIAQLFSHTSGFPGASSQGYESNVLTTLEAATDGIAQNVPLQYVPGTTFYYGSVSMQVAGRICEVVSGKSWKALAADKLFTPCGMTNTDFGETNNPKIAGGASGTPDDYMRFLYMIMNKGVTANGTRVLSEAAITAMETPQTSNTTVFASSPYPLELITTKGIYGIGNWRDVTGPGDALIENCSPGLFGSHPWVNRGKKMTGFIFTYIVDNGFYTTMPDCRKIRYLLRNK